MTRKTVKGDTKMLICILGDAAHINLISWARNLATTLGDKIHVLTFNEPREQTENIIVHVLKKPLGNNKLRYILGIPEVKKTLGRIRPDIAIGYRLNSYGFMAVSARFRPVVVIAQGTDIFYPKKSRMNNFFVRHVIRKADLIHTWARHMADKLMEYGADEQKILVLPKGVDTGLFKPSVTDEKKDTLVLISTRQLRKSYNHVVILDALPSVLKMFPNLQYFICGDGEYKGELENYVKTLGIEKNVKFRGRVEHDVLPSLLSSSDVYVAMQSTDGVSASLLEAMACGVFPIVTDIAANRLWIKDGENGFCVPVNDHVYLANKIIDACNQVILRHEAKRINIELVNEKASMEYNIQETIKIYGNLTDEFKKITQRSF